MPYAITKVEVWAGDLLNRPGMLARVLEALAQAGAQLDFLVGRQVTRQTSRVFVSPLKGKKQTQTAAEVGLVPATGMHSIRIEGPDRPGLGAEMARAVAAVGINIRGVSGATIGRKSVVYLAFNTGEDARAATRAIQKLLRSPRRRR